MEEQRQLREVRATGTGVSRDVDVIGIGYRILFHNEIRSKAIDRERRRYKDIRDFRREKKA